MSKEYYKKKIIDLRAKLQKEKDAKKNDISHTFVCDTRIDN